MILYLNPEQCEYYQLNLSSSQIHQYHCIYWAISNLEPIDYQSQRDTASGGNDQYLMGSGVAS